MIKISSSEFNELTQFLKINYGINLSKKRNLIEVRLYNVLVEKGFKSFRDYLDFVYADNTKEELTLLINKLTTNHTYFMREEENLKFFKNIILPYLSSNVKDKDLRIWSAGCSSGEEAYTLAMIMQEFFCEQSYFWDKKILATDISVDVLKKASNGIYNSENLEEMPKEYINKYFEKINEYNYKVIDSIKNEVIFRIFNLMDTFPFRKKFHVIFCRNVMIYFDEDTKKKLLGKFYDMTEDGGYLIIGLSESINKNEIPYRYVIPSVYRKG